MNLGKITKGAVQFLISFFILQVLTHNWLRHKSSLPERKITLTDTASRIKEAVRNTFTAMHKTPEQKPLGAVNASGLHQRRQGKGKFMPWGHKK